MGDVPGAWGGATFLGDRADFALGGARGAKLCAAGGDGQAERKRAPAPLISPLGPGVPYGPEPALVLHAPQVDPLHPVLRPAVRAVPSHSPLASSPCLPGGTRNGGGGGREGGVLRLLGEVGQLAQREGGAVHVINPAGGAHLRGGHTKSRGWEGSAPKLPPSCALPALPLPQHLLEGWGVCCQAVHQETRLDPAHVRFEEGV